MIHIEPPPIASYRAFEHAPRLPLDDLSVTYPGVFFWQNRAIIFFGCSERCRSIIEDQSKPEREPQGIGTNVCLALPTAWFYNRG